MAFPKQIFRHDPDNGVYGDCHRTAVACLLGLDPQDVPHVFTEGVSATDGHAEMERFLNGRGLATFNILFDCTLDELLVAQGHNNPGRAYLLGGQSRTGCNHTVVCRGGEIIHDPSINDAGIVGPCDDGYFWVTVLTPLFSAERED